MFGCTSRDRCCTQDPDSTKQSQLPSNPDSTNQSHPLNNEISRSADEVFVSRIDWQNHTQSTQQWQQQIEQWQKKVDSLIATLQEPVGISDLVKPEVLAVAPHVFKDLNKANLEWKEQHKARLLAMESEVGALRERDNSWNERPALPATTTETKALSLDSIWLGEELAVKAGQDRKPIAGSVDKHKKEHMGIAHLDDGTQMLEDISSRLGRVVTHLAELENWRAEVDTCLHLGALNERLDKFEIAHDNEPKKECRVEEAEDTNKSTGPAPCDALELVKAAKEVMKMKKEIADLNQLQAGNSQEIMKLREELADIKVPKRESFPELESKGDAVAGSLFDLEPAQTHKQEFESKEDAVDGTLFDTELDKPHTHKHAKDVSEPLITAYELETNIWDLMLFCGQREFMDIFGALIVVLLFAANILLLWILCHTIGSPAFNSYPFPQERLSALWRWRVTEGHSNLFANPEFGSSLASRVCVSDEGLSLSASQEQLYSSVVAYKTSGGYNLSLAAIVVFICQCLNEVRCCIWFFVAMVYLPKTWKTVFAFDDEGCSISSFAYYRAFVAYLIGCCRLATVLYLCCAGCIWLAHTTDIESLLLNTSSLSFVLELDDIFYGAFVPLSSERAFRSVKAIDIKASRVPRNIKCLLNSLPLGLLAVGAAAVVTFNEMYVSPVLKDMGNIEEILCGGSLNFVYGLNIFSQVNWVPTTPPGEYTDHQRSLMSVIEGLSRRTDPEFIPNTTRTHKFARLFNSHIRVGDARAYVEKFRTICDDNGASYSGNLGTQLWALSGWSHLNSSLQKCEDVVKAFPEICDYGKFQNRRNGLGQMIRFACPHACGCADATSGLDSVGEAELGCPIIPCRKQIRQSIEHLPCEDSNFSSLNASATWARLARNFGAKNHRHVPNAKLLIDEGCDGISKFKPKNMKVLICRHIHGASSHCPVACKCRDRLQGLEVFPGTVSTFEEDVKDVCPPACFEN